MEQGVSVFGGILGIFAAISVALILFWLANAIPAKMFLRASSGILLIIAAGLLAHGIVELQEAGVLPTFVDPNFDLTGILSEEEGIGSFLKALFGYNSHPTLLADIGYVVFLGSVFWKRQEHE